MMANALLLGFKLAGVLDRRRRARARRPLPLVAPLVVALLLVVGCGGGAEFPDAAPDAAACGAGGERCCPPNVDGGLGTCAPGFYCAAAAPFCAVALDGGPE